MVGLWEQLQGSEAARRLGDAPAQSPACLGLPWTTSAGLPSLDRSPASEPRPNPKTE